MDGNIYRHNYEDFYKSYIILKFLNKERTTIPKGTLESLVGNSTLSLCSLLVKRFERISNHLEIVWILLEPRHLTTSRNRLNEL